jgi:hypothetical protein
LRGPNEYVNPGGCEPVAQRKVTTHSHETSTTTLRRRLSPAWAIKSEVINLGMGLDR